MDKLKILISSPNYSNAVQMWEKHHFYQELARQANVTVYGQGHELRDKDTITGDFDWSIDCFYPGAKSAIIRTDNHRNSKQHTPYAIIDGLNERGWNLVLNRALHFTYPNAPISLYPDRLKMPVELLLWSLDDKVFSYQEFPKTHDIAFMGAIGQGSYPLRGLIYSQINWFARTHNYTTMRSTRPLNCKKDLNYMTHYYKHVDKTKHKIGQEYINALQQSKIMLTSGSVYQIPVKKYFEAMATGCLLLADETNDWNAVGLVDGESYVEINKGNWKEKTHYYLKNDKERIRIIRNARKLFEQRHTNKVRVKQLIEILHKH